MGRQIEHSVKNGASHGHDSQAVIDKGVYKDDIMSTFTAPTRMEPETLKIVQRDRGTTLLVALGYFASPEGT